MCGGLWEAFVTLITILCAILYQKCLVLQLALGCICNGNYSSMCDLVSEMFGVAVGFGMHL